MKSTNLSVHKHVKPKYFLPTKLNDYPAYKIEELVKKVKQGVITMMVKTNCTIYLPTRVRTRW